LDTRYSTFNLKGSQLFLMFLLDIDGLYKDCSYDIRDFNFSKNIKLQKYEFELISFHVHMPMHCVGFNKIDNDWYLVDNDHGEKLNEDIDTFLRMDPNFHVRSLIYEIIN
jgi:hypothetical protein